MHRLLGLIPTNQDNRSRILACSRLFLTKPKLFLPAQDYCYKAKNSLDQLSFGGDQALGFVELNSANCAFESRKIISCNALLSLGKIKY